MREHQFVASPELPELTIGKAGWGRSINRRPGKGPVCGVLLPAGMVPEVCADKTIGCGRDENHDGKHRARRYMPAYGQAEISWEWRG